MTCLYESLICSFIHPIHSKTGMKQVVVFMKESMNFFFIHSTNSFHSWMKQEAVFNRITELFTQPIYSYKGIASGMGHRITHSNNAFKNTDSFKNHEWVFELNKVQQYTSRGCNKSLIFSSFIHSIIHSTDLFKNNSFGKVTSGWLIIESFTQQVCSYTDSFRN